MILKLLFSHLIGDYVLQCDFIAKTKGSNYYHLLVHCFLYCFPFYLFFGLNWQLYTIFFTHVIIDVLKARFNKITYTQDQILHYLIMLIYLI